MPALAELTQLQTLSLAREWSVWMRCGPSLCGECFAVAALSVFPGPVLWWCVLASNERPRVAHNCAVTAPGLLNSLSDGCVRREQVGCKGRTGTGSISGQHDAAADIECGE